MVTRSELHRLVDELPEEEVDSAAELLDAYRHGDRALIQLLMAPVVPAEPDELAALAELTDEDLVNVVTTKKYATASALRKPCVGSSIRPVPNVIS